MAAPDLAEWLGWHFLPPDRRLQHPPHTLVEVGVTLRNPLHADTEAPGPLQLCVCGYHASRHAIDALRYAPEPVACRVRLGGEVLEDSDKACATERTVLAMADVTTLLHEFACWSAEQALLAKRAAGKEPDTHNWAAIAVKRRWLRGEATNDELAAAKHAAWIATWGADEFTDVTSLAATWEAVDAAAWTTKAAARTIDRTSLNAELERRLLAAMGLPAAEKR